MQPPTSITDLIKLSLSVHICPDYSFDEPPIQGTYGLVFIGKIEDSQYSQQRIAVKTLIPDMESDNKESIDLLKREFEKWLLIPDHPNTLRATQFQIARVYPKDPTSGSTKAIDIPVMPMQMMDGSLEDLIDNNDYSEADRLCAIAQAFNGLSHLYASGIEGHGDLKPSNILYTNIEKELSPSQNGWLKTHPIIVKVADFGWVDAWVDLGHTNKALREYIAPERIDKQHKNFIPERSDIFSMGIIMAELLLGKHPSQNLKRAKESDGEWVKRAKKGQWDLEAISSTNIRNLIECCLNCTPDDRPTANEAVQVISKELSEAHGLWDFEPTLTHWNEDKVENTYPDFSDRILEIERLGKTLGLGEPTETRSFNRLIQILNEIKPKDLHTFDEWVDAANTALAFAKHGDSLTVPEETQNIKQHALRLLQSDFGELTYADFAQFSKHHKAASFGTSYERTSKIAGKLALIAEVDFEQVLQGEWEFSDLSIAALAFFMASEAHALKPTKRSIFEYLDIAIDQSLTNPVPYFFRALWRWHYFIITEGTNAPPADKARIIKDLNTACKLSPDWLEPLKLLKQLEN